MKPLAVSAVLVGGLSLGALLIDISDRVARSQSIEQPVVMATISADGTVFIDWAVVRDTASGRGPNAAQPILVSAAKIILAVRNGTARPMPK